MNDALDTDSYIFKCHIPEGLQNKLKSLEDKFDFSNLDENNPLYDCSKKNQLGLWKLETEMTKKIVSAIALRSKVYCLKMKPFVSDDESINESDKKCLKGILHYIMNIIYSEDVLNIFIFLGISKNYVKNHLRYENYYEALFNEKTYYAKFLKFTSSYLKLKFSLHTVEQSKLALSSFDDKR